MHDDPLPRIVVVGGNGFIGRRIVAALLDSGRFCPVVAARRHVPSANGVEQLSVDATDASEMAHVFRDAAGIVNCVAGDAATIRANARALFQAAGQGPMQPRVVYFSSMAVYGSATGVVNESSPLPDRIDAYGAAKVTAEKTAASYPNAVILRPGIVYGPYSDWWSFQIARLLRQRRLGDLGERGQGICNLIYVEDVAHAAIQALCVREIKGRTFNLAMSNPPTWNDYFERYARALAVSPIQRISAPRLAMELRVVGVALKSLQGLTTALPVRLPPPIRPWLLRLTQHRIQLDVSAAEELLNMTWTPIEQGLEATAHWFIKSGGNTWA